MYCSALPTSPDLEATLRSAGITAAGDTSRDLLTHVVAALTEADQRLDPTGAEFFAERLGWALDTCRVVFATPTLAALGPVLVRAVRPTGSSMPEAALAGVDAVDAHHLAGLAAGVHLGAIADPIVALHAVTSVTAHTSWAAHGAAILPLTHPRAAQLITATAEAHREPGWPAVTLLATDRDVRAAITRDGRERDLLIAVARASLATTGPGLLFIDRLSDIHPAPMPAEGLAGDTASDVGDALLTDPVQFVAASRPVGYINLARFYQPGAALPISLDLLAATVHTLVRALDDALEAILLRYPSALSASTLRDLRPIGVGVCGLADLLVAAGMPYDSPEGRHLAQEVLTFVNYAAKRASLDLAHNRGACPAAPTSRHTDPQFLKRFATLEIRSVTAADWTALAGRAAEHGLRNCCTLAVPPADRAAVMVAASIGIEPLARLTGDQPDHVHPAALAVLNAAGRADVLGFVQTHGRLPADATLSPPLRAVLATGSQVAPAGHLAMATAVQECVDATVATMVPFPRSARISDVYDVYLRAWELGCVGVTAYTDPDRDTGARHPG